jgi:hypothetical protein
MKVNRVPEGLLWNGQGGRCIGVLKGVPAVCYFLQDDAHVDCPRAGIGHTASTMSPRMA